jgi:hypothetical protein
MNILSRCKLIVLFPSAQEMKTSLTIRIYKRKLIILLIDDRKREINQ